MDEIGDTGAARCCSMKAIITPTPCAGSLSHTGRRGHLGLGDATRSFSLEPFKLVALAARDVGTLAVVRRTAPSIPRGFT
jgi:hypothetical protein